MDLDWSEIDHVTKVDPAEELPADLDVLAGTDLVMVGGSDGVTSENTLAAVTRIREAVPDVPVAQEPYSSAHVDRETAAAVDVVAVPAVYNGDDAHFRTKHLELFTELAGRPEEVVGADLPLVGDLVRSQGREVVAQVASKIVGEGYVIQHLDSKAARVSGVEDAYSTDQVAGAALATETFYGFPVFYVEYSGRYGGPADVEAAARYLEETTLLYGGGISTAEQTREILNAGADAVVVGDCFHDDPERFRRTIP